MKNPKNYFDGFLSGASRISRVWGRHSPTRFPQGQNEQKANFGTAVESCSEKLRRSPAPVLFTNKAIAAAGSARFSLTRHRKSGFLPAISLDGRKNFFANSVAGIFLLTPYNTAQSKIDGDFKNFFDSPPRRNSDFANLISPFRGIIPTFFQNAE